RARRGTLHRDVPGPCLDPSRHGVDSGRQGCRGRGSRPPLRDRPRRTPPRWVALWGTMVGKKAVMAVNRPSIGYADDDVTLRVPFRRGVSQVGPGEGLDTHDAGGAG